jgi:hypothetical protein
MRDHVSWRSAATGIASLVTPIGIGVLHPVLGEVVAVIEVVAVLTIIGTALFGSQALSERAFRLLRWIGNRPEPAAPAPVYLGGRGTQECHDAPSDSSQSSGGPEPGSAR